MKMLLDLKITAAIEERNHYNIKQYRTIIVSKIQRFVSLFICLFTGTIELL